jgi:hypothetical protein
MCCQGWLTGEAIGHKFYPGKPCGWLAKNGCLIYESRPYNPCQTFVCVWKNDLSLPEWLRPDQSGVIVKYAALDGIQYLIVVANNRTVPQSVHDWAKQHSDKFDQSIVVPRALGSWQFYGQEEHLRNRLSVIYNFVDGV